MVFDFKRYNSRHRFNFLVTVIICFLGILIYSNTFNSPFVFDDTSSITENSNIRSLKNLDAIWRFGPTHFIVYLSLAVNYHFHQLNVFGYHLINLIIHLSTALMVWQLALLTFLTPAMKNKEIAGYSRWLALFSGLLFVSHPVQTEAVTYIIQRGTSVAAFFYITSLTLYIKARLSIHTSAVEVSSSERARCCKAANSGGWKWYYILSLSAAILGMFSKQIVITLPLIIVLYECCFFKNEDLNTSLDINTEDMPAIGKIKQCLLGFKNLKLLPWRYLVPYFGVMFIVPLNMALSTGKNIWQIGELTRECEIIPRGVYLLTQFRVLVTYLRLFFAPLNQNLDYDYPLSQSLWELPVLAGLLLLVAVLTTGIILFKRYRLISFSIFWFFIALSVESSLIPIKDVIFEHRLYLPMVGYSLFLPMVLYYFCRRKNLKLGMAGLIMLISCYSILTYTRNWVWQSEFALWDDAVIKSPNKARPRYNRGNVYQRKGDYVKALLDYTQTIKITPNHVRAYNNRAFVYQENKKYDKALSDYTKMLLLAPVCLDGYQGRGSVYGCKGEYEKAIEDYTQVIAIDPGYFKAYCNRGNIYRDQKKHDKALADYNSALMIKPDYTIVYYNRANVYADKGEYDKAVADYSQAIVIDPGYIQAYINRGGTYLKTGEYDKAIFDYSQVVKIDPEYVQAYNNRGIAYAGKEQHDKAIDEYTLAVKINQNYSDVYYNRALSFFARKEYDKARADVEKGQALGGQIDPDFLEDLKQALGKE